MVSFLIDAFGMDQWHWIAPRVELTASGQLHQTLCLAWGASLIAFVTEPNLQ